MSAGMITEEDVEGIRCGRIVDPLVSQVAAFAAAFGVPPSFLLDRNKDTSVLDEEVLEVLADETAGAILRESARLPEREKRARHSAAVRKPDRRCLAVAQLPAPVL